MKFIGTPLRDGNKDYGDNFIRRLQDSVNEVKASREMGARYMTFEELLKDEREEGKAEGRAEGIRAAINIARKYHVSDEEIVEQLITELSISVEEARTYIAM